MKTGLWGSAIAVLFTGIAFCVPNLALAQTTSSPFLTGATALQSNILAWLTPIAIILVMVLGAMAMANRMVQLNSVGHTGADGFKRLANQALFAGAVAPGATYLVVDDFVGQGGTLANLIGFIRSQGGEVLGATVLTGKAYSAKLAPDAGQIDALRHKHGRELETWWAERFGFDFDRLTRSEARYLENTADADTIRDRIIGSGTRRD